MTLKSSDLPPSPSFAFALNGTLEALHSCHLCRASCRPDVCDDAFANCRALLAIVPILLISDCSPRTATISRLSTGKVSSQCHLPFTNLPITVTLERRTARQYFRFPELEPRWSSTSSKTGRNNAPKGPQKQGEDPVGLTSTHDLTFLQHYSCAAHQAFHMRASQETLRRFLSPQEYTALIRNGTSVQNVDKPGTWFIHLTGESTDAKSE